ncbi:bifunctional [glutamine synthetase] adenylyltransferase/[glutamine synthetase]-adenylyl-L-tyrosine phosphorylase [Zavarzinia compransoris]|uniref:bifunctional [glutamine synthetase] adenylyltransferase/[glutamine synthetase]-adenylyl-L-tyrosine phosphorylase n=1 Tax=Zavarzinia marina TaxID=2911065 RepID=UPI001F43461E|nr:bifunctional [glutamine synthetase] adenylyltransferase/[glutamine synthetase]-adenylyl-L-tyrosine phosphorylase [Zavarzinia marina]MCF4164515.1 bifunctional [glutamine synthetase] adenylyltransferase/[glutamine synthetase]-adenylyl-L-tyrosine phosphorylase [Zavarzinia marina]
MNYGLPARPPCAPPPGDAAADRPVDDFAATGAVPDLGGHPGLQAVLRLFGAYSPYLTGIVRRDPEALAILADGGADALLARVRDDMSPALTAPLDIESLMRHLRRAKARLALAAAHGDLVEGWPVMRTTIALSDFAERALSAAAAHALRLGARLGELTLAHDDDPERESGLVILGMGKLGAGELNYSSDIDLIVFYDSEVARPTQKRGPTETYVRVTKTMVKILQERTKDGYVFRVDLALRPDPGAMPVAISTDAAEIYYQSLGQNWERSAMIKAKPVAGDKAAGHAFLAGIRPFVWRRHLDFAAVRDIQRMKERIRDHHGHGEIAVEGQDVKLGPGGIREVEFFVQIQQLISGGREPALRQAGTLAMLDRLREMERLTAEDHDVLVAGYCFLRHLEHRLQMVDDAQTHSMPTDAAGIARIGRFMGYDDVADFRAALLGHLAAIESRFGALFAGDADAARDAEEAVLPPGEEALAAHLADLGFREPVKAAGLVHGWRVGRYRCFRHERARALADGLTPVIVEALAKSAEPDLALLRFDQFLSRQPAGVQLFSLLDANRALLDLLAEIMGAAPYLADVLSRRPGLLDSVAAGEALRPLTDAAADLRRDFDTALCDVLDYQDLLDSVRRWTADKRFAVGIQLLRGLTNQDEAGAALSLVADLVIERLVAATALQFAAAHGVVPGGSFAVVGFGKLGGREMTLTSDLDLVFLCHVPAGTQGSDGPKPLSPGIYYTRLGQRLISALSALTAEGSLYEVDVALRPAGSHGPLVAGLSAFAQYYEGEAWTWEHLALSRARLIAATSADFAAEAESMIDGLKRRRRDPERLRLDMAAMRGRMEKDRPARGRWDLKLRPGGLIDIEFIVQTLFLAAAPDLGPAPLPTATAAMIELLAAQGLLALGERDLLRRALALQAGLSAVLRLTAGDGSDVDGAPAPLQALLVRHAQVADFAALEAALDDLQARTRACFIALVGDPDAAYVPNSGAGTGGLRPMEN